MVRPRSLRTPLWRSPTAFLAILFLLLIAGVYALSWYGRAAHKSEPTIVFGKLNARQPLVLRSHMPENGVIFSDGIEADYVAFNSGAVATIGVAERKAHLIVRE